MEALGLRRARERAATAPGDAVPDPLMGPVEHDFREGFGGADESSRFHVAREDIREQHGVERADHPPAEPLDDASNVGIHNR